MICWFLTIRGSCHAGLQAKERGHPQTNIKPKVNVTLNKAIDGNVWTTFCKPLKKLKKGDRIIFSKDLSAEVVSINFAQCVMNFESGEKRVNNLLKRNRRYAFTTIYN